MEAARVQVALVEARESRMPMLSAGLTLAGLAGYAGNSDGNADAARFWNPQGLAVDAAGNVYVADTGNDRIQVLGNDGKPRLSFGEHGSGPGQFRANRKTIQDVFRRYSNTRGGSSIPSGESSGGSG